LYTLPNNNNNNNNNNEVKEEEMDSACNPDGRNKKRVQYFCWKITPT